MGSVANNFPGDTWGDEIYFSIPVDAELENGQDVVELGEILPIGPPPAEHFVYSLVPRR